MLNFNTVYMCAAYNYIVNIFFILDFSKNSKRLKTRVRRIFLILFSSEFSKIFLNSKKIIPLKYRTWDYIHEPKRFNGRRVGKTCTTEKNRLKKYHLYLTIWFFFSHYDKYARIKITRFFPYRSAKTFGVENTSGTLENAFRTVRYSDYRAAIDFTQKTVLRVHECSFRNTRVERNRFRKGHDIFSLEDVAYRIPDASLRRTLAADPAGTCISMSVSITVGPDDPSTTSEMV